MCCRNIAYARSARASALPEAKNSVSRRGDSTSRQRKGTADKLEPAAASYHTDQCGASARHDGRCPIRCWKSRHLDRHCLSAVEPHSGAALHEALLAPTRSQNSIGTALIYCELPPLVRGWRVRQSLLPLSLPSHTLGGALCAAFFVSCKLALHHPLQSASVGTAQGSGLTVRTPVARSLLRSSA